MSLTAEEILAAKREGIARYTASERKRFDALERGEEDTGAAEVWWLWRRELPDGRVLFLSPMSYGNVRLHMSPPEHTIFFDDEWCYHDHDAAWRAVLGWDGTGEPDGWIRNPTTGRRRPDGDASKEYVQW